MFSKNLKNARRIKGLSQEQLAGELNVVRQTVSKWEKGLSVPDAEMLIKLSEVLGVPLNELLDCEAQLSENEKVDELTIQVERLNELLNEQQKRASSFRKKAWIVLGVVLLTAAICAVFATWTDMWYAFGRNLHNIFR